MNKFWQGAFTAAWQCAKAQHLIADIYRRRRLSAVRVLRRTQRQLQQVQASYCDAALQLLSLDKQHQLLKLRSPTQLNDEYAAQVLAVSLSRPDASPTAIAEQKRGAEMIQVVEVLATAIARSFERAGLITAPRGTPAAQLLEEIRNIFDANACYNWPNHSGRAIAARQQVSQIEQCKPIDV